MNMREFYKYWRVSFKDNKTSCEKFIKTPGPIWHDYLGHNIHYAMKDRFITIPRILYEQS